MSQVLGRRLDDTNADEQPRPPHEHSAMLQRYLRETPTILSERLLVGAKRVQDSARVTRINNALNRLGYGTGTPFIPEELVIDEE